MSLLCLAQSGDNTLKRNVYNDILLAASVIHDTFITEQWRCCGGVLWWCGEGTAVMVMSGR